MSNKKLHAAMALVLILLAGCNRSGSASAKGGAASPLEQEAQAAAMAEIGRHWTQGPDGWTTALNEGTSFAPIPFLRQLRELTPDHVEVNDLSDADRMNGFEWAGEVWLKESPAREAGEHGIILGGNAGAGIWRNRGHWSQWADYQAPPLHVQKMHGKWNVQTDNTLVTGTPPGPADYANAGVR